MVTIILADDQRFAKVDDTKGSSLDFLMFSAREKFIGPPSVVSLKPLMAILEDFFTLQRGVDSRLPRFLGPKTFCLRW